MTIVLFFLNEFDLRYVLDYKEIFRLKVGGIFYDYGSTYLIKLKKLNLSEQPVKIRLLVVGLYKNTFAVTHTRI